MQQASKLLFSILFSNLVVNGAALAQAESRLLTVASQDVAPSLLVERVVTQEELQSGYMVVTGAADSSLLTLPGSITVMVSPGSELTASSTSGGGSVVLELTKGMSRVDVLEGAAEMRMAGRQVTLGRGAAVIQITNTGEGRFALVYGSAEINYLTDNDTAVQSGSAPELMMQAPGQFAYWQAESVDIRGPFVTKGSDLDNEFVAFRRVALAENGSLGSDADDSGDGDRFGDSEPVGNDTQELQVPGGSVPSFNVGNSKSSFGIGKPLDANLLSEGVYSDAEANSYGTIRHSISANTVEVATNPDLVTGIQSIARELTAANELNTVIQLDNRLDSDPRVIPVLESFGTQLVLDESRFGLLTSGGFGVIATDSDHVTYPVFPSDGEVVSAPVFGETDSPDTYGFLSSPNLLSILTQNSVMDSRLQVRNPATGSLLNSTSGSGFGDNIFTFQTNLSNIISNGRLGPQSSMVPPFQLSQRSITEDNDENLLVNFSDVENFTAEDFLALDIQRIFWNLQFGFDGESNTYFDANPPTIENDGIQYRLAHVGQLLSNDEILQPGMLVSASQVNANNLTVVSEGKTHRYNDAPNVSFRQQLIAAYLSGQGVDINNLSSSMNRAFGTLEELDSVVETDLNLFNNAAVQEWLNCGVTNALETCFTGGESEFNLIAELEVNIPRLDGFNTVQFRSLAAGYRPLQLQDGTVQVDRDNFLLLHATGLSTDKSPTQLVYASGSVDSRVRDIAQDDEELQNPDDTGTFSPISKSNPKLHRYHISSGLHDYKPFAGPVGEGIRAFVPFGGSVEDQNVDPGLFSDSGLLVVNSGYEINGNESGNAVHADLRIFGNGAGQDSALSISIGEVTYSEVVIQDTDGTRREGAAVHADVNVTLNSLGSQRGAKGTSILTESNARSTAFGGGDVPSPSEDTDETVNTISAGYASYLVLENYVPTVSIENGAPVYECDFPYCGGQVQSIGTDERAGFALTRLATATSSETIARQSAVLSGFAAALTEYEIEGGSTASVVSTDSTSTGLTLNLNSDDNSATGTLELNGRVFANSERTSQPVTNTVELDHNGAFIDNQRFALRTEGASRESGAAVQNNEVALVSIETFRGTAESHTPSETLPVKIDTGVEGDMAEEIKTYNHLTWGLFLGDIAQSSQEREHVHMGTWVAGEMARDAELPVSGSATFAGHAIGNVRNGDSQYTSVGSYENKWNFGDRAGDVTIRFDSQEYTGRTVAGQGAVTFGGNISNADRSRVGSVNGAFYGGSSNGQQPLSAENFSQGGQFEVSNFIRGGAGDYVATGTFAADVKVSD